MELMGAQHEGQEDPDSFRHSWIQGLTLFLRLSVFILLTLFLIPRQVVVCGVTGAG